MPEIFSFTVEHVIAHQLYGEAHLAQVPHCNPAVFQQNQLEAYSDSHCQQSLNWVLKTIPTSAMHAESK